MLDCLTDMRGANLAFTTVAIGANLNLLYTYHIGKHD